MYKSIRWIHGQLALALALAVLVYALSGWFIHYGRYIFPETPTENETHLVEGLSGVRGGDDRDVARETASWLGEQLGVPGRLIGIRASEAGWSANFASASRRTRLTWSARSDQVQLEIRPASFGPSLKALHRVHGTQGGPAFFLFALVVDLVGVAMIVYAITGVILWWNIKRKKGLGLGILTGATALTVGWISLLAWGP